jgi:threonine dehydrogenase-like Zn-dependent dehydrogenase
MKARLSLLASMKREHRLFKPLMRGIQYRSMRHLTTEEEAWGIALVASKRVQTAPLVTHILDGIEKVPEAIEITAHKSKYGAINPAQVRFV